MSEMFHVTIRRLDGDKFSVVSSFGGEVCSEPVTFTASEQYKLAKRRLLVRTPRMAMLSLEAQLPVCGKIGKELFDSFFIGTVLTAFRHYRNSNCPPRLGLHLGRELYPEPWELLKDPEDEQQGDFLSLIGSLVRFDADSGEPDPKTKLIPPARSLRCLFVSPQPTQSAENERVPYIRPEDLENISFDIVTPPTYDDLQQQADSSKRCPDGFIFFGHGKVSDGVGQLIFVEMKGVFVKKAVDDPRACY